MPDEENVGGGMNEAGDEGGQQSGQQDEGQYSEGAFGDEDGGRGEGGQGHSNVGDWDPAQQGGGGGEVY
jgi:hypothetical protein